VRRWISRLNDEGLAGLANRPRCGRPWLGGRRLPTGSPRCSSARARGPCRGSGDTWDGPRSACGRCTGGVRLVAIWRRPKLTARGDPDHDHAVAGIVARLLELPRRSVVLAEDETH
jgi:hypothetical protein